jgi:hypothetical protein
MKELVDSTHVAETIDVTRSIILGNFQYITNNAVFF